MTILHCPECMSIDILVYEETAWDINKFEVYCHSVKLHDDLAKSHCMDCDWVGYRKNLKESESNEY